MKVLTKYFKVVLCFMAFALCSFMFAFTPTLTAVQAAEMAALDLGGSGGNGSGIPPATAAAAAAAEAAAYR